MRAIWKALPSLGSKEYVSSRRQRVSSVIRKWHMTSMCRRVQERQFLNLGGTTDCNDSPQAIGFGALFYFIKGVNQNV